jgi:septal ring factor EnvC (AmiA/AmiB activator)
MSSEDTDTNHYQGALLEEMNDRLKALLEGQQALAMVPSNIARLQTDMTEVKGDIRIIKATLKIHSTDINGHEKRITHLETQIAA